MLGKALQEENQRRTASSSSSSSSKDATTVHKNGGASGPGLLARELDSNQAISSSEAASLSGAAKEKVSYGATAIPTGIDSAASFEDDNSLVQSYEDDDDDEEEEPFLEESLEDEDSRFLLKVWRNIQNFVRVVVNVENLWDEKSSDSSPSPEEDEEPSRKAKRRRRNYLIVIFWFVVLATSYAAERSSFKLLVDLSGPFRIFAVQAVTAAHAIVLGIFMFIGHLLGYRGRLALGIPVVDVALMAVLDTMNILLVFLSGYHVAPTLSVILVQFTLPLTVFLTQLVHPSGKCTFFPKREESLDVTPNQTSELERSGLLSSDRSRNGEGRSMQDWGGLAVEHIWGSLILTLAVLVSLIPSFYSIVNPEFFKYADTIPMRTAANTLLYVCSCFPAAASQLYKEHIFLHYKQPVNMDLLNLLLSVFTFIFALIMSPLLFGLQGLGESGDWTKLYPSEDFSENFSDGIMCFANILKEDDQLHKYPDDARCKFTFLLTILYAFSVIGVGVAVDKIVNAGATPVTHRGISAGIILAVLCMYWYDLNIPYFSYGPLVDSLNLVSLVLLVLGSEVYHRVMIHESSFETEYAQLENIYEDE